MICQWQELLNILPGWLKSDVDKFGKQEMQELRLRLHTPPEIVTNDHSVWLNGEVSSDDLNFCLNTATRYSPWTSSTIQEGFVTAIGGHRIGICGECVYENNRLRNISPISSICIRVARNISDISKDVYQRNGSVLIIGRPGSGKTTFLRDLIHKTSENAHGSVAVIDERRELFPFDIRGYTFPKGVHTDVLSGCKKRTGMEMALRTLNPYVIAVDEITGEEDCLALLNAAWCGVRLFATAHAGSHRDLLDRKVYQSLMNAKLFDTLIILQPDKTWKEVTLP